MDARRKVFAWPLGTITTQRLHASFSPLNVPWLSLPSSWQNLMHASFCLLLWQPVLALHPAPRAAPALGARRTAPPARAVRHDAPRMSTDSNPDSLEDVFEALLKARRGLCLG